MSVIDRILGGVTSILTTQQRIDVLKADVKDLAVELREQDRRLIRVETIIEIAQQRGPSRLADER